MATKRTGRSPRWDLLGPHKVKVDDELLLSRWRFLQNPLFAFLFTRIYMPDPHRDPHDHSRPIMFSVCLTGSYTEALYDHAGVLIRYRHHYRFVPYYLPHSRPHRIVETYGKVRTFVLAGPHHGTFWFYTKDGPVDYRVYRK